MFQKVDGKITKSVASNIIDDILENIFHNKKIKISKNHQNYKNVLILKNIFLKGCGQGAWGEGGSKISFKNSSKFQKSSKMCIFFKGV